MIIREGNYTLGVKLGIASLGWAALSLDAEGAPTSILAAGVRKFPVGATGDVASGREEGPNARRQEARSTRVRLARRVERLRDIWQILQSAKLLPPGSFKERGKVFEAMPASPYILRAKALDAPLPPYELGRAIYHLAQRRGFQSNRRDMAKPDEDLGVVKQGIADLKQAMADTNARTVGEFLSRLDSATPCRRRWLGRDMLREEFNAIQVAQAPHHPAVSEKTWEAIKTTIFFQRPLKSQAHRVGKCDLEPSRRRAQLAALDAQEFRVLCRVNDLRLVDDVGAHEIALTSLQRQTLLELLRQGDASFPAVRKALGLPKTVRFNAERIDDEKLLGFRTEAKIRKAIGSSWDALGQEKQALLVDDLLNIDDDVGLLRRLRQVWQLDEQAATALLATTLEPSYAGLSRKAIARMLPLLRNGIAYATVRAQLYPRADFHEEKTALPLIQELYPHLSNPLVRRALGELRVVVNALVAKHGRPTAIRVSLMRELRLGRKAREQIGLKQRQRTKQRAQAAARVLTDLGVQEPTRWMVDKVLLADECGWTCPYTGKMISMRSLLGGEPTFEVIHLVPFHRSLDDSYENKTLCHISAANGLKTVEMKALRQVDEKTIGRFEKFAGEFAGEKLRRARLTREEIVSEFSEEIVAGRFVDACYSSKLAADMLSRLYPSSRAAVTTVKGAAVGFLREACGLHRIDLPDGNIRRAAVDALAVALAGPQINRRLSAAALGALPGRRRLHPELALPWSSFARDAQTFVESLIVSARVRKKVSGALHEETVYRGHTDEHGKKFYSVRKHLWQLTPTDLPAILGAEVRGVVEARLVELKQTDPRKAFAHVANLPAYRGRIVRAVRIKRLGEMFVVGEKKHGGRHSRNVATERNHHAACFMRPGRGGKTMADRVIVNQFEAQARLSRKEAVVVWPPGVEVCKSFPSLSVLETLSLPHPGDTEKVDYFTVRCVSKDPAIVLTRIDDARTLAEINADKARIRASVEQLRLRGARKVVVTPLGEVRRDNT